MEAPQLGRYVIQSELGRGAMASCTRRPTRAAANRRRQDGQHGARKHRHRQLRSPLLPGGARRGQPEPCNIVTVYDVGKAGDIAYMAMEFIEGVELRSMIGEGRYCRWRRRFPSARKWPKGWAMPTSMGRASRH